MEFKSDLSEICLHRIQFTVTLRDKDGFRSKEVKLIVDTGCPNTLVSQNLADMFSAEKIEWVPDVALGGQKYSKAEMHVLPCIELGPDAVIKNVAVESVVFDVDYELYNAILLGLNTLNNWDYAISIKDKYFCAIERFPAFLPNKAYPYKNYLHPIRAGGEWVVEYCTQFAQEELDSSGICLSGDSEGSILKNRTVHWLVDGAVYHTTQKCKSLEHSAGIKSGTVDQSGKLRVCKKCGSR